MTGKFVDKAVEAAFAGVEYAEMAFQAFEFARMSLPRHNNLQSDPAMMAVRDKLTANLGEQYRRLFMWSTITVDDEVRKRAKELAMRRFLAENIEVMPYLSVRGEMPGGWMSTDEQQFRDEVAALIERENNNDG